MIDEIKIENFRGFASLELPNLKRVNLIVGENNAGKTSLLEAIVLLCDASKAGELPYRFRPTQGNADTRYFRWLLRDNPNLKKPEGYLDCTLEGEKKQIYLQSAMFADESGTVNMAPPHVKSIRILVYQKEPVLVCRSISVFQQQTDHKALVTLVGRAQRKGNGEETLQNLLAKVDPRIKKIRVDPGTDDSLGNSDGNQVIVDIGLSELIPLTQTGQGVNRLMSILADLIGETPDVLLIDEIENGLHHSVQEQIWTGLAEAAEKLNVQIFATTHSNECLRAANAAFQKRQEYDFSVIQLFRVKSGCQGRVLDQGHIEAAIAGDIDLR